MIKLNLCWYRKTSQTFPVLYTQDVKYVSGLRVKHTESIDNFCSFGDFPWNIVSRILMKSIHLSEKVHIYNILKCHVRLQVQVSLLHFFWNHFHSPEKDNPFGAKNGRWLYTFIQSCSVALNGFNSTYTAFKCNKTFKRSLVSTTRYLSCELTVRNTHRICCKAVQSEYCLKLYVVCYMRYVASISRY